MELFHSFVSKKYLFILKYTERRRERASIKWFTAQINTKNLQLGQAKSGVGNSVSHVGAGTQTLVLTYIPS